MLRLKSNDIMAIHHLAKKAKKKSLCMRKTKRIGSTYHSLMNLQIRHATLFFIKIVRVGGAT